MVGDRVGLPVGDLEGDTVGLCPVGLRVGDFDVGCLVGFDVIAAVGFLVGGVGLRVWHLPLS